MWTKCKVKLGLSWQGRYLSYTSNKSIVIDRWTHIAWVVKDRECRIYIDGELDSVHDIPPMTQNDDMVTVGRQEFNFDSEGNLELRATSTS